MKNKIEDLRNHLFAAIENLMDEEKPMDIDRAKAVSDVAQVIINSAKVEVDFINKTGMVTTNFLFNNKNISLQNKDKNIE
jgi:hypothetical protein